jgi:hypothetical protein
MTGLYWNKDTAEAPNPIALDDTIASRLWAESERLVAGF